MSDELTQLLEQAARTDDGLNKENKITIIAWGGDLDRIWPTLILSTTAAASGMEASVFFTFWGLFTLVKPDVRITGDNWMQKMLSVMNPGNPSKAKLSRYHFAGAGPGMMKKLAKDYKTPLPSELLEMAQDMGVRLDPVPDDDGSARTEAGRPDRRARGTDRRRHGACSR